MKIDFNKTKYIRTRVYQRAGETKFTPVKTHPSRQARKEEIDAINRWLIMLFKK